MTTARRWDPPRAPNVASTPSRSPGASSPAPRILRARRRRWRPWTSNSSSAKPLWPCCSLRPSMLQVRTPDTSKAIPPASARTVGSTRMRQPGRSSPSRVWDGPTRRSHCSACSIPSAARSHERTFTAIASNPTQSPRISTPSLPTRAAGVGPGTRVRQRGSTAPDSRKCWGFESKGRSCGCVPAYRRTGPVSRSSSDTAALATRVEVENSAETLTGHHSIAVDGLTLTPGEERVELVDDGGTHHVRLRLASQAQPDDGSTRRLSKEGGMTWTRVCFTDREVAAGDRYRLQRKFTQLYDDAHRSAGIAMFSTAFLPGRQSVVYFSPAVLAEFPSFTVDVGAQGCESPSPASRSVSGNRRPRVAGGSMTTRLQTPSVRFLNGSFRRLHFSRDGHVSGVVLKMNRTTVSVMMGPREGAAILRLVSLGRALPVLATFDQAANVTGKGEACYALISLATPEGRPRAWPARSSNERVTRL